MRIGIGSGRKWVDASLVRSVTVCVCVLQLEKLLCEVLGCLQSRSTLAYDDELLALLSPLLCVMFPHKNKHLRSAVAQFWNATFANTVRLAYPEELR